jgi:hypothetical protein
MRICLIVNKTLQIFAFFFLIAGFLLYETTEKRIEDALVRWWVRLDDAKSTAVSKTTAFMRGIAQIVGAGCDLLFGEKILSARSMGISLGVSLYFTGGSFFLFGAAADFKNHLVGKPSGSVAWDLVLCLAFVFAGISPAFIRYRWYLPLWTILILINGRFFFYLGYVILVSKGVRLAARYMEVLAALLMVSYLCDVLYVSMTRWILRVVQRWHSTGIVLMCVSNIMLGIFFIFAPILIAAKFMYISYVPITIAIFSPAVNSIDIVAAFVGVALALFMLIHRFIFWPLILRPLYGIARLEIGKRRALLWGIGVCLWNNQVILNLVCKK